MHRPWRRRGREWIAVIFVAIAAAWLLVWGVDRAATRPSLTSHMVERTSSPPASALHAEPSPAVGTHPAARHRINVYGATGAGMFSPAVRGIRERVYVPNSESGSVSVIDPRSFRVVRTYAVGRYPEHITPSWDMRRLYVDATYSNTLVVIDPRTGASTGRTIPVTDPYNLYFTPDGAKAIVVAEREQRLDFYDPHTWRRLHSVRIPASGPDHLDFSANGRFLLVSAEFSGWVFKVDTHAMRVVGQARVGGLPIDVRLSPSGRRYFVANQGLGGVTVLSARSLRTLTFLRTGAGAHGLAVSRNGRSLYVSNRLAGSISVIDFAKQRVVATWRVGGSPDMMQVSPDGRRLWVTNRFNGTVAVISTTSGRVEHLIDVGRSPHGLCLFPQPGTHSLGHNGIYR